MSELDRALAELRSGCKVPCYNPIHRVRSLVESLRNWRRQ